jgi:dihydroorotate dehydrogenase (NAD+) catalytic subunit
MSESRSGVATREPVERPSLEVEIGRLRLQNPVMSASGCFGWGAEYAPFFDLNRLGALVGKAVTIRPRRGNPGVRIAETPAGMLNAIGLQNDGLDAWLTKTLPRLEGLSCAVIANLSATSVAEYAALARAMHAAPRVDGLEINVSCPNVGRDGVDFCVEPDSVGAVVRAVRAETDKTVICKLSPNVTDIVSIALSAEAAGADGLSVVNTFIGMAVNVEARRPVLANVTGGLSGPCIKPIALRMVYEVASAVGVPVIGIGGITTARDALEFLIAGATAIQVGTANFTNPLTCPQIIVGIEDYLSRHGYADVRQVIGSLYVPPRPPREH